VLLTFTPNVDFRTAIDHISYAFMRWLRGRGECVFSARIFDRATNPQASQWYKPRANDP
jgi:hypothetical protein